jgi:hypothetical protein
MADGRYPDIHPDEPGSCAGCGRLPEQVEAIAGPPAGPVLCVDCVDRARAEGDRDATRGGPAQRAGLPQRVLCALCGLRPGVPAGADEGAPRVCRRCLDGLAAAMAEPD